MKFKSVVVRAGADGQTRWERRAVGWYVLPNALRKFAVELGGETCKPGEMLTAELISEDGGPDVHQRPAALRMTCGRRWRW